MSSSLKGLPLPIDSMLEALRISLAENSNAVLVAEPGAGKSTRVPPFLAQSSLFSSPHHRVLVLQPRRVAVFGLAKRIAEEQGWRMGDTIGYQVRMEKNSSAATRVEFITEGILIRRLLNDPELKGIGCVVLDEFHERNLFSDLAIAWLKEIQAAVRPDLKILVMSATLDSEQIQAYLSPCASLKAPGRLFPLTEIYSRKPMAMATTTQIVERVIEALGECLADPNDDGGDILVFLPGAREIRRCVEAAEGSSRFR
ncbi:MAG: DEAD/DEAH box helicase, partial [Bdellovibrionales bacterium]|nr:DEAD/DEAH box helicase [Bdellovibrionales bacterium]